MNQPDFQPIKVVALAGGVGGARLADGLAKVLPPEDLTIIVNTGDDFEHFGLFICPDIDTVCYTLAGLVNPVTGWGRRDETWTVLEAVSLLGGPTWFHLGDQDLGLHLERTRRRLSGQPLSRIVQHFCQVLGIRPRILPMTDDFTPTWVYTIQGEMPFQEYFVRRQCQPVVTGFCFQGADQASPAPGVLEAIHQADLVVFCPSNPWVSLDPILSIPGIRSAVASRPVVAVSPIIGGQTVKGPAGKMFTELGIPPSAAAVAHHYTGLLSGFVIDQMDSELVSEIQPLGVQTFVTDVIMKTPLDRARLSKEVIDFGIQIIH
ncbi:MAG: 2-phospho-L-lactate transferase [Chloroflexi bacterium RBG_16_57_11]|nr:MAG: 2-phospho-L-lactate transferase [Chloroflexi bacterium RBG_16_57_11]